MNINITEILLSLISLFAAGGWWTTWKASQRKADGEAVQSEADGWSKMQAVYQEHIEQVSKYLKETEEKNAILKQEKEEMSAKYLNLQSQIKDMQKKILEQGEQINALYEMACSRITCNKRMKLATDKNKSKKEV